MRKQEQLSVKLGNKKKRLKTTGKIIVALCLIAFWQWLVLTSFYSFDRLFMWDEQSIKFALNKLGTIGVKGIIEYSYRSPELGIEPTAFATLGVFHTLFGNNFKLVLTGYILIRSASSLYLYSICRKLKLPIYGSIFVATATCIAPQFPYHQFPFLFSFFSLALLLELSSIHASTIIGNPRYVKKLNKTIIMAYTFISGAIAQTIAYPIMIPLEIFRLFTVINGSEDRRTFKKVCVQIIPGLTAASLAITFHATRIVGNSYNTGDTLSRVLDSIKEDAPKVARENFFKFISEMYDQIITGFAFPGVAHASSLQIWQIPETYPTIILITIASILIVVALANLAKPCKSELNEDKNHLFCKFDSRAEGNYLSSNKKKNVNYIIWCVAIISAFVSISLASDRLFSYFPDPGYSRYAYVTIIPSSILIIMLIEILVKRRFRRLIALSIGISFITSVVLGNYYSLDQTRDLYNLNKETIARYFDQNAKIAYKHPTFHRESILDYTNQFYAKYAFGKQFRSSSDIESLVLSNSILAYRTQDDPRQCVNFSSNFDLNSNIYTKDKMKQLRKNISNIKINSSASKKLNAIKLDEKKRWISKMLDNKHINRNLKFCILYQSAIAAIENNDQEQAQWINELKKKKGLGSINPDIEHYAFKMIEDNKLQ